MRYPLELERLESRDCPGTVITVNWTALQVSPLPGLTVGQESAAITATELAWQAVAPVTFENVQGPAEITIEGGNAQGWLALTYGTLPDALIVLDTSHYRFYGLPETAAQQANPSEPLVETLLHEEANALALPETFSDPSYTTSRAIQGHDWTGPADVTVKLYPQEQAELTARFGGQPTLPQQTGGGTMQTVTAGHHGHHHHWKWA